VRGSRERLVTQSTTLTSEAEPSRPPLGNVPGMGAAAPRYAPVV